MSSKDFRDGIYDTHFIDNHIDNFLGDTTNCTEECEDIAAIAAYFEYKTNLEKHAQENNEKSIEGKSWKEFGKKISILRL
jgi:acetyl/propionyl-CoA carboxylase alpha subunit